MSDSRRRSHDTSDDEMDHTSRNVRPRRSIFSDDPYLDPTNRTEESDPEEEPFEDEEDPRPTHSRSPSILPTTVPSASTIPPSPVFPSFRFATHRQEGTLRWDWMPRILDWWRRAEQIPVLPEAPGLPTPIPPLTQEPAHHTIPIIVTRLLTHDHQLDRLERAVHTHMDAPTGEVELLQHQVSGVESELAELRDDVVTTHTRGVEVHEEVASLRQQLTALQQEVAEMRAEREQFRADAASSARMCGLLGDMSDLLR